VVTGDIDRARALVEGAERIVVLTGAGISAESGVPTFRGAGGLWKSHRPEELATPQAFRRDPLLVWEWYAWRRGLIADCDPNAGHMALARLMLERSSGAIVTQNVDGLHTRAAHDAAGDHDVTPALPIELHGAIDRDQCSECRHRQPGSDVDWSATESLPRCERCDGLMRPDVVWFGESLDPIILEGAFSEAGKADLCLVVGTSAVVHPAASVPLATLQNGGALVEVNPEETPLTIRAAVHLALPSAEVLPLLLET
jgi:NAD-dependent deacetylase